MTLRKLLLYAPFVVFLGLFLWGLNASYPLLGYDNFYVFPRLLAGKQHVLREGLLPFWYTAQFCGGFPVYGNPNDIFYSLPQLFSLFLDLWTATQLSIVIAMVAGYIGWMRFGRSVMGMTTAWAHVLALIILANGSYFLHMLAGHSVYYYTLALMGWFLWFLCDRTADNWKTLLWRTAVCGLLATCLLYAAGYFVLLLIAMTAAIFCAFDLLLGHDTPQKRWRVLWPRAALFTSATIAAGASKLVAVYSMMRFFPRSLPFDLFPDGTSVVWFLMKSFFVFPQTYTLFPDGENKWGIHEISMFLSPLVIVGSVAALWIFVRHTHITARKKILLGAMILFVCFFFGQLARGHGCLIDWLHLLPVFSSIHVTVRFLYVPQVLLSIAAVSGLAHLAKKIPLLHGEERIVLGAGAITILFFLLAYVPLIMAHTTQLALPYDEMQVGVAESQYLTKTIDTVETTTPWNASADIRHVFAGSTGNDCYEPLVLNNPVLTPLLNGPVTLVTNGAFNLHNPACFQYPAENNCVPGSHILESDIDNLNALLYGGPVSWKVSTLQHVANGITLLSLLTMLGFLLWTAVMRVMRRL